MKSGAACQWPPNARFWVWETGGWVRLTLKPGDRLRHDEGGPTDEGYDYCRTRWKYVADEQGPRIEVRHRRLARDCDGPLEEVRESVCEISRLRDHLAPYDPAYGEQQLVPDWQKVESWQRDHYAEAVGY